MRDRRQGLFPVSQTRPPETPQGTRIATGFRGDSQFTTWVYAIAIRTVLADLRRRRWREVKRRATASQ